LLCCLNHSRFDLIRLLLVLNLSWSGLVVLWLVHTSQTLMTLIHRAVCPSRIYAHRVVVSNLVVLADRQSQALSDHRWMMMTMRTHMMKRLIMKQVYHQQLLLQRRLCSMNHQQTQSAHAQRLAPLYLMLFRLSPRPSLSLRHQCPQKLVMRFVKHMVSQISQHALAVLSPLRLLHHEVCVRLCLLSLLRALIVVCRSDSDKSLEIYQAEQRKVVGDLQQREQQQLHNHFQQQMNIQTTQAQQELIQASAASWACRVCCLAACV
jgi:hypothetical protein